MCLNINKQLTEQGLKGRKVHPNGMVKLWKVVRFRSVDNALCSPHKPHVWRDGWNKSDRESKRVYEDHNSVHKGIHVLMNRESARNFIFPNSLEVIIPVYVRKKELIACGNGYYCGGGRYWDAVFMKVFLKREDHQKAVQYVKNKYKSKR